MADLNVTAKRVHELEGGFQRWRSDKGNYYKGVLIGTNKGVTPAAYLKAFGKVPTVKDMKGLTYEQYLYVFRTQYWPKWRGEEIVNQQVADIVVDWFFNSGAWGIRIPQRILGLKEDGIVGPKTIAAVNAQDPKRFFAQVVEARAKFFRNIVKNNASQAVFLDGWLNRLNTFKWV